MHDPPLILSIEDEDNLRKTLVAYLEDSGFDMIEAENGRIGVEVFERERPDVVLCDLRMPEMDGLTALSKIREISETTPFIIVSGTGDIHDAVEALKLGAWDFIMKPIQEMEVLEHAVQKALTEVRLRNENEEFRQNLIETNARLKESLKLLEEDETAARRVQVQLLPEARLTGGGYEFSHHLRPSSYLSGDFVDYFQLDDQRWCFYIADVSGHGASSAFITVLLKSMMGHLLDQHRAGTSDAILDPYRVLKRLNEHIASQDLGKYLTMFYGVLNRADGTLTYANGGHFPRPVYYSGDRHGFLEEGNLAVGLFKTAEFQQHEIQLPGDFVLAAFSDGVFEVIPRDDVSEQQEALTNVINRGDVLIEDLIEEFNLDGVEDPPDDIAVLLVRGSG